MVRVKVLRVGRGRNVVRRVVALLAAQLLALTLAGMASAPALAGSKTATLEVGTIDSVARADNGDGAEVNGAATFSLQPKSVSGDASLITEAFGPVAPTFTHGNAGGDVLAEGTWERARQTATRLHLHASAGSYVNFAGETASSDRVRQAHGRAATRGWSNSSDGSTRTTCSDTTTQRTVTTALASAGRGRPGPSRRQRRVGADAPTS